jgi:formamidopyrimidine-DNA glycosylase
MPELPDISAYITALEQRMVGRPIERVRLASPFLLRTVQPPIADVEGRVVRELRRVGKRIAIEVAGDFWLVLHLMIAGRLHWRAAGAKLAGRNGLAAFDFPNGTLVLTEAGAKRRASLHVFQGEEGLRSLDAGGIDVFASDLDAFRQALTLENRTLKRALTDPRLLSGIGNAYSDEILHAAQLSPITLTHKLEPHEWERLFAATRQTLQLWIDRLRAEAEASFPEKVTAFRRYGGARALRSGVRKMWRKDSTDSLRGQGNELLRAMSDGWKSFGGSWFVAAFGSGLAAHAGRT